MAFDEGLAHRIREIMEQGSHNFDEKNMFGGMSFMIGGNVACGVIGDRMVVRVGSEGNAEALAQPFAKAFDFTGKPMSGWIYVAPEGLSEDDILNQWVNRGVNFASSLPPK